MKYMNLMALLLISTLSGCASQSALDNTRNDVDSIKTRLFTMERDFAVAREESKSSAGDVTAVRRVSADLQATIDSIRSDMQALNGRFDDAILAAKKPAEDLARYREDADKRIIALEDHILKQQTQLDSLSKKMEEMVKAKNAEAATPDALYLKGLDLLKAGDSASAREQFTQFLAQNPKHELAANAQYWIGETYYNEKNYESAILAYQEVIKSYPGKEKVAAAMLKQAMSFSQIKDSKSAKYVLKKLVEGFPKSDEARKAKALLKEMR